MLLKTGRLEEQTTLSILAVTALTHYTLIEGNATRTNAFHDMTPGGNDEPPLVSSVRLLLLQGGGEYGEAAAELPRLRHMVLGVVGALQVP